ncbi:hypothetical protein D922_02495 [Enterococcus faecalis 06-MB-DW-09]|nr:hypothetical protein D922_02495 [Enterococcus faecalis 06-MB-DW-09]
MILTTAKNSRSFLNCSESLSFPLQENENKVHPLRSIFRSNVVDTLYFYFENVEKISNSLKIITVIHTYLAPIILDEFFGTNSFCPHKFTNEST